MPTKKIKKPRHRPVFRNATLPRTVAARAVASRAPRPRPGSLTAAFLEQEDAAKATRDTRGWRAVKAAGGALATTVAGAYLARQDWLPPKAASGVLTALGLALAVGSDNHTAQSLGLGVMSAAGGQLGFMVIDDELMMRAEQKEKKDQPAASKPPADAAKRQASDIPADALARAYERARLRMALASDPN